MLRSKLLREIYQQPNLARADLTRITGASSASVTQIIRELLEEGVVIEQGREQEGLGRPRVMLSIDPAFRHVVGLRLISKQLSGSVLDLRGNCLCTLHRNLPSFEVSQVLQELQALTEDLLNMAGLQSNQVLGVGLALSGIVDVTKRSCVYSFLLGWKHVPIGELLEAQLGLPVVIENDVNSITIAQKLFGEAALLQYFAVLFIEEGIGAGFYHQDRLLTGQNNAAGEIGHFTVVRSGRSCICGKKGCLQAYASRDALLQQARELGLDVETLQDLHQAALNQDPEALRLLTFAGQLVGLALSFVIDTLDVPLVLVYAGPLSEDLTFQTALLEAVRYHSLPLVDSERKVVFKPAQQDLWLSGAGSLAINAYLNGDITLPPLLSPSFSHDRPPR
ncbi:ROK family transcriptional regulator [Deinococcus roseus]|uniref:ROK family protein n=1 Tax=Deinococcus roseus TaxID=392414 RepID=A0ABQ2CZF7_9DEIO|nr:ROK family transcriptional regulator [Deinococcus roseus]GGJ35844.1 ROK family protein [Deinococcus roseus]